MKAGPAQPPRRLSNANKINIKSNYLPGLQKRRVTVLPESRSASVTRQKSM